MDLKKISVLIDGYNLELPYETGIKTYGMTLIKTLKLLGAEVNVLFSRGIRTKKRLLKEVLFFDIKNDKKNYFNIISTIKTTLKAILFPLKAEIIENNNIVVKRLDGFNFFDNIGIITLKDCYRSANILFKTLGFSTNISIPHKIDVWHATYPLPIKIKKAKKITTIHDLIPLRLPYTTSDDKKRFFKILESSIKDSSIILCPSENTKNDILNIYNCNPEKIFVTYQPTELKPLDIDRDMISAYLKKFSLKINNYILFVGTIEPKKNIKRLIDAYLMLDTHMPLVIAGKRGWLWRNEIPQSLLPNYTTYRDISKKTQLLDNILDNIFQSLRRNRVEKLPLRSSENIRFLEHISNEDLRYLYAGAFCLVFPSLYEGFGLPPLEAMTFGCPVITSRVSSLPEICGDAAYYIDPYDVCDIKQKIEDLLNSPQTRRKLSEVGKQRVHLFSIENYAKKLYEAYCRIL
ncbi:MAG: glycosyltransferase family 4 protein [Thermodesulfovibrionales bacterium]